MWANTICEKQTTGLSSKKLLLLKTCFLSISTTLPKIIFIDNPSHMPILCLWLGITTKNQNWLDQGCPHFFTCELLLRFENVK